MMIFKIKTGKTRVFTGFQIRMSILGGRQIEFLDQTEGGRRLTKSARDSQLSSCTRHRIENCRVAHYTVGNRVAVRKPAVLCLAVTRGY